MSGSTPYSFASAKRLRVIVQLQTAKGRAEGVKLISIKLLLSA